MDTTQTTQTTTLKATFACYLTSETPDTYEGKDAIRAVKALLRELAQDITADGYSGVADRWAYPLLESIADYGVLRGRYALDTYYPTAVYLDIEGDYIADKKDIAQAKELLRIMRGE